MIKHAILKLLKLFVIILLRFEHHRKHGNIAVIFQNDEDKSVFIRNKIITEKQAFKIKGSGVNLHKFRYTPEPDDRVIRILFTARMLKEKGVLELIGAAMILKEKYADTLQFLLCGDIDNNPNSLTRDELNAFSDGKYIVWLGHRSDVRELLAQCHIFAFPSYYREGVPKSLIEACAAGRPIVTTDSVGCKDCVIDGYNGFLVPIKDSAALAQKIEVLINDKNLRIAMSKNSRVLAELDFSIENVVEKHIEIYNQILD